MWWTKFYFHVFIEHYHGCEGIFGETIELEVFAPSSLRLWCQMPERNRQIREWPQGFLPDFPKIRLIVRTLTLSFRIPNGLLIPDFSSWRYEERDTILKSLCWPYNADPTQKRAARLVMFNISVGRDPKNPTTSFNGHNLTDVFQWSNLNWRLFKISKFSGPFLLGMTLFKFQSHFLSGGFIMTNGDCCILCARA